MRLAVSLVLATTTWAANNLFAASSVVKELQSIKDFYDFIRYDESDHCERKLIMAYSSQCPHCHNFAPTWERFGKLLHSCDTEIPIGAFECVDNSNRGISHQDYKNLNHGVDIDAAGDLVEPVDICRDLGIKALPTILAIHNDKCSFGEPAQLWHDTKILPSGLKISDLQANDASSSWELFTLLERERVVSACKSADVIAEREAEFEQLATLISEMPVSPETNPIRWEFLYNSSQPALFHDAIVGLYILTEDWVQSAGVSQLNETQLELVSELMSLVYVSLPTVHDKEAIQSTLKYLSQSVSNNTMPIRTYLETIRNLQWYDIPRGTSYDERTRSCIHCEVGTCAVWTAMHYMANLLLEHSANNSLNVISLQELPAKIIESNPKEAFLFKVEAQEVVKLFAKYVSHFFTCDICRTHFSEAVDRGIADLRLWVDEQKLPSDVVSVESASHDYQGMIMWLWRMHNVVTCRTAVFKSIDTLRYVYQQHPDKKENIHKFVYANEDVRFPPPSMCEKCHKEDPLFRLTPDLMKAHLKSKESDTNVSFDLTEDFDLVETYKWLRNLYRVPDAIKRLKEIEGESCEARWNKVTRSFCSIVAHSQAPELTCAEDKGAILDRNVSLNRPELSLKSGITGIVGQYELKMRFSHY